MISIRVPTYYCSHRYNFLERKPIGSMWNETLGYPGLGVSRFSCGLGPRISLTGLGFL